MGNRTFKTSVDKVKSCLTKIYEHISDKKRIINEINIYAHKYRE